MNATPKSTPFGRDYPVDAANSTEPRAWLTALAAAVDAQYLLAYADDGVIWGRLDDGALQLSSDAFPEVAVRLDAATLQAARLFGPKGELIVRRDGAGGFAGWLIEDACERLDENEDEKYWLWGRRTEAKDGFVLLAEGRQGLHHAPPQPSETGDRLALRVRHYIDYDDQDQAYIRASRLVGLVAIKEAADGAQTR
jgi:CRISPR-associated protein (TIGR03984 family)